MDNRQDKKVYCPCCGSHEKTRVVLYHVDIEEQAAFGLKGYSCEPEPGGGVRVSLPSADIEAGPWNGDRFLVEYSADHYECRACNKMFAVQR